MLLPVTRKEQQRARQSFLARIERLTGFINYDGELPLKVNSSLLSIVLHD